MELTMHVVDPRHVESDAAAPPFWLTPPAYWMPQHFPVSAWHTHAPFAAWLMDVLRPRTLVELGTHLGFSCFAFAEAAGRLRIPISISALDSWEGDEHAGFYGEEVYDYVRGVVSADYPASVNLIRGLFSESRPLFADESVDVLHIDGRHAYEDARADYEQWRSSVREGGVILFHDIAERDNGFGVWRLWEEIAEPDNSFSFGHGHGLGVLGVGVPAAEPLRMLFTADAPTAAAVRADFSRLGDVVARQAYLESLPGELERTWAEIRGRALHEDQLAAEIEAQSALLAAQGAHIADLKASTSWRVTAPLRSLGRLRAR
jgi:hypothetical protein